MAEKSDESVSDIGSLKSFSLSDFQLKSEDSFKGFRDQFNFTTTILMQLTFGLSLIILSVFPNVITSFLGFMTILTCNRWLRLHGTKMTRKEVIFFEAANLLEVDPPKFQFGLPSDSDDCMTPGDGIQRENPQPQTLWDALFTDERKMRMDKFYREHYGRVHETGMKMMQEYEIQKDKKMGKPP